jgi:hypothetical protein
LKIPEQKFLTKPDL